MSVSGVRLIVSVDVEAVEVETVEVEEAKAAEPGIEQEGRGSGRAGQIGDVSAALSEVVEEAEMESADAIAGVRADKSQGVREAVREDVREVVDADVSGRTVSEVVPRSEVELATEVALSVLCL